jgi:hypothetical protein
MHSGLYEVESCLSLHEWRDTGELPRGAEKVHVLVDEAGRRAFQKPGEPHQNNPRPVAEYVASVCAHWIGVRVPKVKLADRGGPASLSCSVEPCSDWATISQWPPDEMRRIAVDKFSAFTNVVVLDLLVALADEERGLVHSNHVFRTTDHVWYSIDYAPSLGHPKFSGMIVYQDELVTAMREFPSPIRRALVRAQRIPDNALGALSSGIPDSILEPIAKRQLFNSLKKGRDEIGNRIRAWCAANKVAL